MRTYRANGANRANPGIRTQMGNLPGAVKRQNERMTVGAAEHIPVQFDEDTLLAQRFLAGDASAFNTLYQRYYEKVFVVSKGVLLDTDDAHDAAQETFSLIHRNLRRFNYRSKLGTWIFRIAVNTAIQQSRRLKNKKRNVPISEALEKAAPEMETDWQDASRVNKALAELAPTDRAILTLFYWDELSLNEIGDTLSCGPNAAKTRLYRARERFRAAYEALEISHE